MKLETTHYQLARHYQNTACLCTSTLQPPDRLVCYEAGSTKAVAGE